MFTHGVCNSLTWLLYENKLHFMADMRQKQSCDTLPSSVGLSSIVASFCYRAIYKYLAAKEISRSTSWRMEKSLWSPVCFCAPV